MSSLPLPRGVAGLEQVSEECTYSAPEINAIPEPDAVEPVENPTNAARGAMIGIILGAVAWAVILMLVIRA